MAIETTSLAGERTRDSFTRGKVNFNARCEAMSEGGERCVKCEDHPDSHKYATKDVDGACPNCGYNNVVRFDDGTVGCEDCAHLQTPDEQSREALAHVAIVAGLAKLDACRTRCPGIGGDIDAMNMRHMLQNGFIVSAMKQAASTLDNLSRSLEIDARKEVIALNSF